MLVDVLAMCGNSSETSMPHCPYFLNVNGLGISGPGWPCRTTTSPFARQRLAGVLVSAGLGSNVSTWLTPPLMNSEITPWRAARSAAASARTD